jgi:hypothetical protein
MKWMKHIVWIRERRNSYKISGQKTEGKINMGDTDTCGRIILILTLQN